MPLSGHTRINTGIYLTGLQLMSQLNGLVLVFCYADNCRSDPRMCLSLGTHGGLSDGGAT